MERADLVLEGGGVKGIGLVGAISTLREAGYEFPRVAGTSAGAVAGCLVAAGIEVDELERLMRELDYRKFRDETLLSRFGVLGKGANLLLRKGIYKGDWLHDWVSAQLAAAGRRTWGDLRITPEEDPRSTLRPEQAYKLVVIVSDVSDNRLLRLPWDYHLIGTPQDQVDELPVADAVRASASIPFFFQPCKLQVAGRNGPVYLTDGGMLSNFPIDVFDRRDGQDPRWPTFGVKLSARPDANLRADPPHIDGPLELAMALVGTMSTAHDQMHLDDPAVVDRTMFVDSLGVKATDFDIDEDTQDRLYEQGRKAGTKFLDRWKFTDYLQKHRRAATGDQAGAAIPA